MWLCALGLGCSIGWLWTFFLNGPILTAVAAKWSENPEIVFLAFLLFQSLSYLLTAFMLSRKPSMATNHRLLVSATLFMAGGTLAVGLIPGEPFFFYRWPLVLAATVLAGLGWAPLLAAWGEAFGTRPVKEVGLSYAFAICVGTALFFVSDDLNATPASVLAATYPLLSLALYLKCKPPQSQAIPAKVGLRCPLPFKLIVLLALFYLTNGFMHKLIYAVENLPLQETYWVNNITYCLVGLLAGTATFLWPDLDLRLLYRPALPLLGAGFTLFPLLGNIYEPLPFALVQSGFALFDVYTWLLFVYLGSLYHGSGYMVSWGMFCLSLASFCGELVSNILADAVSLTNRQLDFLAIGAALIMFLATLIFQDKRETFAGWSASPVSELPPAPPAPALTTAEAAATLLADAPPEPTPAPPVPVSLESLFCEKNNLTARESEITLLLLKGRNNPYIRESLNISDNTLKTHLRNIYRKLDVTNRQDLFSRFDEFRHRST